MCLKSSSAARTSLLAPKPIWLGSPRVALFRGENMPLAAGRIRAACWSFPSKDRKRLRATCVLRSAAAISFAKASTLFSNRRTVRSAPLMRKPRISFSMLNRASPFSSFLRDAGSLPPT